MGAGAQGRAAPGRRTFTTWTVVNEGEVEPLLGVGISAPFLPRVFVCSGSPAFCVAGWALTAGSRAPSGVFPDQACRAHGADSGSQ